MEHSGYIALGLDLGRSGKTAFSALEGADFHVRQCFNHAISSISAPDVEQELVKICGLLQPQLILVEADGPGGVFSEFVMQHHPELPLMTVYTGHPALPLMLWQDIILAEQEYLNIRAEMYWIVRLLLRDSRLMFQYEDPELFAQLTSTQWDADKGHGDRIRIVPKKMMRINYYHSELEGNPGSRSPDKADALALSCLAYAILYSEEHAGRQHGTQSDDIIEPEEAGFFPIGMCPDIFEEA